MSRTKKKPRSWDELRPYERRVRVARDVIAQLDLKKYVAAGGTYFRIYVNIDRPARPKDEVCDLINRKDAKCSVCAIGALFASHVRETDEMKASEMGIDRPKSMFASSDVPLRTKLGDLFGNEQLGLIESAFEMCDVFRRRQVPLPLTDEQEVAGKRAERFNSTRRWDAEARMRAIMDNIIDNRGKFVP